jgi:hypothetical protein
MNRKELKKVEFWELIEDLFSIAGDAKTLSAAREMIEEGGMKNLVVARRAIETSRDRSEKDAHRILDEIEDRYIAKKFNW